MNEAVASKRFRCSVFRWETPEDSSKSMDLMFFFPSKLNVPDTSEHSDHGMLLIIDVDASSDIQEMS